MRNFCLALLIAAWPAAAQTPGQPDYVRAHYTKYDFRIPMRDGVKLFTSVYVPKDASQPYPILMQRTPYSVAPYGADNYPSRLGPSELFMREGYIFAYQDVRGRNMSEGAFIDVAPHVPGGIDDSTDTYDTVDWLIKNVPNNNGRLGIWGVSYPGFYAAFSLIGSHPALKAVSPQAPMMDVGNGDDAYHNGALFLAANYGFYAFFKPRRDGPEPPREGGPRFEYGTPDAYDYFLRMGPLANAPLSNIYWDETVEHWSYDAFWQSRALAPYMKNVTPAVLAVGGWFDAEDLSGPLKLFRALEADGAGKPHTLVMGPFTHGGWTRANSDKLGNLSFASNPGEYYRGQIEFPFFQRHLKQKGAAVEPKAWVFETGTNEWKRYPSWPPPGAKEVSLFLDAAGKLSFTKPEATGYDEYLSDPDKPVPVSADIGPGMPGDYMTFDQRFASKRPDVLTYATAPLDRDVTIAGPITPVLRVSTSGTDSDFDVKLIDVYPDNLPGKMGGYQQLVRGEPFRGKFRNGMTAPQPFRPGVPEKIEFTMPDVCHTFRPGHRIMVQIQSSWFPLTDRNPQQFVDIPKAKPADFRKAMERVFRGGADGSFIRVLETR